MFVLACGGTAMLLVAACGEVAPATSFDSEQPEQTPLGERPSRELPTPTPDNSVLIDAIVLATDLDEDGAPEEERSSLPPDVSIAYLAVLVRDVDQGTLFQAEWRENGEEIGWSEFRTRDDVNGEQWVTLRFAPAGGFSAGKYSVRLSVDGSPVESLVFSAGGAERTQASSTDPHLVFTQTWGIEHSTIDSRRTFPFDVQQVVAVLTNAPRGSSSLTSEWRHGAELLARVDPGPFQIARTRTFTFQPDGTMPSGRYFVGILDDDEIIAEGSFIVESAPGTATDAEVLDFIVTDEIDLETGAPGLESVDEITAPAELIGLLLIENLSPSDLLEVTWLQNGEAVSRTRLIGESVPRNWVTFRHSLSAEAGQAGRNYRVIISLNGDEVARHDFIVR